MKLHGYTQIGLMTGLAVIAFQLVLIQLKVSDSPLLFLQFPIILIGILYAEYLYNKNNRLVILDLFVIGFRTLAAALVLIITASVIMHFIFNRNGENSLTNVLGGVVFSFGLSGVLSSFVSAVIISKLIPQGES